MSTEEGESGEQLPLKNEWEPTSPLDKLVTSAYWVMVTLTRLFVIGLAVSILLAQVALGQFAALDDPIVGAFIVFSVVPAAAVALYVWHADVTESESLQTMVVTVLLGILFAMFALVLNSVMRQGLTTVLAEPSWESGLGILATMLYFLLVVGPVEEGVKLLAVRMHAFNVGFGAVIDGAVYGAMAGLGFATIENAFYITRGIDTGVISFFQTGAIASVRSLAGPGHVLYSAIAGYYLGLAKFNSEYAGPLVLKGLLIAAVFHAGYNILVGIVPGILVQVVGVNEILALVGFIVGYDALVGLYLLGLLVQYRRAHERLL